MTKLTALHQEWLSDPAYRAEYDALEAEFEHERRRLSDATPAMTFTIYRGHDGGFRWRLTDAAGRALAESATPVPDRDEIDRQIQLLRAAVGSAHIVDEAA